MELMVEKLLGFVLVVTRISAFFLVIPVFSWKIIPVRIKVATTLLLAVFFTMITPLAVRPGSICVTEAILLIANEATYGLALAVTVTLVFSAVKLSGRIIERQMGMDMAQVMDPLTCERTHPLGKLL